MEKLLQLINACKCSITLEINEHKNYHQGVKVYLEELESFSGESLQIEDKTMEKMVKLNTIILIQFYPETAFTLTNNFNISRIGFYRVFHYDLEMAIDQCLDILKLN